ncbi:MAG: hypothetical protein HYS08_06880 [Chlamydiae bacterium]|nr:hypothetical protein [Chlamydiota bacterium]MBI3265555.1 hypothetical protein [Chlamydiota bacterium]
MKFKILTILILSLLFPVSSVFAVGLRVSPGRATVVLKPGEQKEGVYHIKNTSNTTQKILVQAEDWVQFRQGKPRVRAEGWLNFEKTEFVLDVGEETELKYKVLLDKDFRGEKVAQVFFTPVPTGDSSQGVSIRVRSGVLLMAIAKEDIQVKAEIGMVSWTQQKDGVSALQIQIKDAGNVHIKLGGEVKVLNEKGDVIWKGVLDPAQTPGLFAGEERPYSLPFNMKVLKESEKYLCVIELDYGVNDAKGLSVSKKLDLRLVANEVVFAERVGIPVVSRES